MGERERGWEGSLENRVSQDLFLQPLMYEQEMASREAHSRLRGQQNKVRVIWSKTYIYSDLK